MLQDHTIQNRLMILYYLKEKKEPAHPHEITKYIRPFTQLSELDFSNLLNDMAEDDLLRWSNQSIELDSQGLVVLSFFQDRLDATSQKEISTIINENTKQETTTHYIWYDHSQQLAHFLLLKQQKKDLYIEIPLSYDDFRRFQKWPHQKLAKLKEELQKLLFYSL